MRAQSSLWLMPLLLAAGLTACSKSSTQSEQQPASQTSEIRVANIELGDEIHSDKRVVTAKTSFEPNQTVYASVATDGSASSATLTARWTYQDGQVVEVTTETIAPTGPAVTEFHVSKPTGWPAGRYAVEILLNGSPAGRKEFEIKG